MKVAVVEVTNTNKQLQNYIPLALRQHYCRDMTNIHNDSHPW